MWPPKKTQVVAGLRKAIKEKVNLAEAAAGASWSLRTGNGGGAWHGWLDGWMDSFSKDWEVWA